MLYLEDYLELIEHLPIEIKDGFTQIKEIDNQIQNGCVSLDSQLRVFFNDTRRMKQHERDVEVSNITHGYDKLIDVCDEKVTLADSMYTSVDKYLRRLDQDLYKFKLELEADTVGITEILERRSLEMDNPGTLATDGGTRSHGYSGRNRRRKLANSFDTQSLSESANNATLQSHSGSHPSCDLPSLQSTCTAVPADSTLLTSDLSTSITHSDNGQLSRFRTQISRSACPTTLQNRSTNGTHSVSHEQYTSSSRADQHTTKCRVLVSSTATTTSTASTSLAHSVTVSPGLTTHRHWSLHSQPRAVTASTAVCVTETRHALSAPLRDIAAHVSSPPICGTQTSHTGQSAVSYTTDRSYGSGLDDTLPRYKRRRMSDLLSTPATFHRSHPQSESHSPAAHGVSHVQSRSIHRTITPAEFPAATDTRQSPRDLVTSGRDFAGSPVIGGGCQPAVACSGFKRRHSVALSAEGGWEGEMTQCTVASLSVSNSAAVSHLMDSDEEEVAAASSTFHSVEDAFSDEIIADDEPRYCICQNVSYGEMVACDNQQCPYEWFHYACVDITAPPKGKWYCPECASIFRRQRKHR